MQESMESPIQAVAARCVEVLRHTPSALLTDIDGTISPMARTPDSASVLPQAREALQRLRGLIAMVGVVTGRSATVGAALVDVDGLVYVGNHGMEWIEGGQLNHHAEAALWTDNVRSSLVEITEQARASQIVDGLVIEDKGLSGSIHYRLVADIDYAQKTLLTICTTVATAHGLRVTEGRMVLEIRPPVQISKGTALTDLIRMHGLRGIVFLGDDVTDVDGFVAVREARDRDGIAGLRVGVLSAEVLQPVLDESDVTVGNVAECGELLAAIADRLDADQRA